MVYYLIYGRIKEIMIMLEYKPNIYATKDVSDCITNTPDILCLSPISKYVVMFNYSLVVA